MTHLASTEITSDPTLQSRQDGPYIVLSVVEQGKSIPVIGMLPRAYRKWLRMELARWSCEPLELRAAGNGDRIGKTD